MACERYARDNMSIHLPIARRIVWCAFVLFTVMPDSAGFCQPAQSSVERTLSPIRGDLYRVQEGRQTTVVLVGTDGILIVDPLNAGFARWLRQELETRFPGRPVKYVVYTNVDFNRVRGAWVFKPAEVVAHGAFNGRLSASARVLPPQYATYDEDSSGVLERTELAAALQSHSIVHLDLNSDGEMTSGELWSEVALADSPYTSRRSIAFGGKSVDLIPAGPEREGTAVLFRDERMLFVGRSLTPSFADRSARPSDVARWADTIASLEYDTLLTGNGTVVPRTDVTVLADYSRSLLAGVIAGYEAGRTLEEIRRDPTIGSFAGTSFAARRDSDIISMYERTRIVAVDAYGAALGNHLQLNSDPQFCSRPVICNARTTSGLGASTGLGVSIERYRVAVEMAIGSQLDVSLGAESPETRQRSRETHLSVLGGYRTAPSGTFNITLLAGPTFTHLKTATTMQGPLFAQPISFSSSAGGFAFTFGADVFFPVGRRLGVIAPIRLTRSARKESLVPFFRSGVDIRAGVGLTFAVMRRAT